MQLGILVCWLVQGMLNEDHAMETDHGNARTNPASLEALWIEERLKRYVMAGSGLFLWAFFVGQDYHTTRIFFVASGIAVLLALAGLIVKRYRRQYLFATFGVHLILWMPCLYPIQEWPGGDDGAGMAWFWFLGGACLVDFGVTVKNLIVLCRHKARLA
jgi:hypothetical protein